MGGPRTNFFSKTFPSNYSAAFYVEKLCPAGPSGVRSYVRSSAPNPADWPYVEPRSRRHKGYPGSGITVRGPDFGSEHYLESYGNIK